jgi:hypothetical protein
MAWSTDRERCGSLGARIPHAAAALPPSHAYGDAALFLFFSNRTGCGTSLLITALGSLILLWLTGWLG